MGRINDVVVGPDGRRLTRFNTVFEHIEHILEGQIVQEEYDLISVNVVPDAGFGPADADGVVTVDEIRALEAAKFAEADTNGDGVLDQDELLEHAVAQMRERAGEMLSRMIAWQDKDGDGALSADEMPGDRMGAMLSRVDADGDGQITAEEYETAISKHRDRGERGRHGHGHGDRDDG